MGRDLKRYLARIGLVVLFVALGVTTANAGDWAGEMFAEKSHNFGKVPSNSNTQYTFTFKNKYRETIHIASVRSTCNCTTPTVLDATVASLKTGRILATFNTKSFTGPKSATVTVVIDKPYYAEVQLVVSGEILSDVNVSPPEVGFGQVAAGQPRTSEVRVSFLNRPNIRIEDVRSLFSDIKVRLSEPTQVGNRVDYTLAVTLKESAEPGEIGERLTLVTNDPTYQAVAIGVTGQVRPPVEVKPDAVHFDTVATGNEKGERLLLRADSDFTVTQIECDDPRFTFEVPDGSKKVHFVKMTFRAAGEKTGEFKVPVRIKTNLGESATAVCTVTGSVLAAK